MWTSLVFYLYLIYERSDYCDRTGVSREIEKQQLKKQIKNQMFYFCTFCFYLALFHFIFIYIFVAISAGGGGHC